MVDHRPDEDRPRRAAESRPRSWPERGVWLCRCRRRGVPDRAHRRISRSSPSAVLPWDRDRRARARCVRSVRPRDARARPARIGSGVGDDAIGGRALAPDRVAQHDLGPIAFGGEPGGPGQQPERRDGVGAAADRPGRGRALDRADRPAGRRVPRHLGDRPDRDRCAVRSNRSKTPDRCRDASSGAGHRVDRDLERVRPVVGRRARTRPGDSDGLPDADRGRRRRRRTASAGAR